MAYRRARGRTNSNLITVAITGLIVITLAITLVVETGVWAKIAKPFGLPAIHHVSELFPQGTDRNRTNLQLELKKPNIALPENTPQGDVEIPNLNPTKPDTTKPNTNTNSVQLPAASSAGISMQTALNLAENMPTATPHPKGYNRAEQFGSWIDSSLICGRGSTRDYILKRDMTNVGMDSQCRVTSGNFVDPYTGNTMKFQRGKNTSELIQIDHVVALQDAYASGLWRPERAKDRVAYANDPDVLLASQGAANNTKSMGINLYRAGKARDAWQDSTPSIWIPSYQPYQCEYVAKRVNIKHKWDLTMSPWEKQETVDFLKQCIVNQK